MSDKTTTVNELKEKVSKFVKERDWEQFHSPKNLSMAIAIEASELMEKFQWLNNKESIESVIKNKKEIEDELADIINYIFSFCNLYNIDIANAVENKIEINRKKYPIEKCIGKFDKYTSYL